MTKELTQKFKTAYKLITSSKHITLATASNHDEDALGSILAFAHYLRVIGKEVSMHLIKEPSPSFSFLPGFDMLENQTQHHKKPDLIIAFDHGNFERLELDDVDITHTIVIALDHHPQTAREKDINIIDTSFSSTAEIAYLFFEINNIKITTNMAACIYAGIVYDTGGFYQSNTSSKVFEIASKLILLPFNAEQIYKKVLGFRSPDVAYLTGLALKRLSIDKEAKTAYSYISYKDMKQMSVQPWADTGIIVELMKSINSDDIKCILLFKEKEDEYITCSFRSDATWRFNVNKLASIFGGGGHTFSSGARIDMPLKEAMESVLIEIKGGDFRVV